MVKSLIVVDGEDDIKFIHILLTHYKNKGDKKIVLSSYKAIFDEPEYNFPHKNFDILKDKLNLLVNRVKND